METIVDSLGTRVCAGPGRMRGQHSSRGFRRGKCEGRGGSAGRDRSGSGFRGGCDRRRRIGIPGGPGFLGCGIDGRGCGHDLRGCGIDRRRCRRDRRGGSFRRGDAVTLDGGRAPEEGAGRLYGLHHEGGQRGLYSRDCRIAVFDLDGTLFCETDPNYFDYCLLVHRVLEDPDYKDRASDFERQTAEKIVQQNETGESFEGLELDHGQCIASSFAGMTIDEFSNYIQEFKKLPMPSYEGMTRGEGFYLPMLQVVDYLQANDFTVYVVSGTDRFIVRGLVEDSPLHIPPRQIIGSDETIVTKNQGDTDGLDYLYDKDDELVLGGDFIVKNLKMNKVAVIAQEIGQQPVLSFGNSTGDSSMAEYVTSNNPFRSMAFMLCCDDTERENGNVEKADKMFSLCEEYGWTPVSMKNDWTTIYGDSVTRKTDAE